MRLLSRLFHRKLSKERFVKRVLRAFSESGASKLKYDEAEFSIILGDSGHRAYLSNAFAACRDADETTRGQTIQNHVSAALHTPTVPTSFASARPNLLPVVRDPAYNALFRLKLLLDGKPSPNLDLASQTIADELVVGLAYDSERSISFINQETFKSWNVSLEEALKAAKDNLRDLTDPNGWVQQRPGTFLGAWNDSYESSRVLLTDYIYRLSLDGDPVLFVPNRGRIWITGSTDPAGLEYVLHSGKQSHFEQGHPISPNLYRLNDGSWTRYVPPEPDLRSLWESIRRDRDAIDYQQQKEDLEKLYEKNQIDIFVASYSVFRRKKDNSKYSMCVWSRGVDSLLPKAEIIVFMANAETKDYIYVRWDSALRVIGRLMEIDPELVPVRYRVKIFPNETEIAQLRRLAATPGEEATQ